MAAERPYHFIIVGGGTAGCVLASRLSENAANRVLLIEAGSEDRCWWLKVPAASFKVSEDPRFHWGYSTVPQAAMDGRRIPLIQAKVLGGGSSINGMVHTRGAAGTFDAWRALGCDGWGYEDVLPYFRAIESSDRGESRLHGARGFMKTIRAHSELPISNAIMAALGECGIPIIDDLNVPVPDGVGLYDWCIGKGRRASMPAVLPGLRHDRPNFTIMTDTAVSHLHIEGNRVTGVRVVRRGTTTTIRTEREVIMCAGAIGSPKILLLSGIGPAQELEALGIAVRLAHPHVGHNLQNHVAYRLEYSTNAPMTARRYVDPRHGCVEILRYVLSGTGVLGAGAAPIGGFLRSTPDVAEPDVQLFAIPALMGRGRGFRGMLPERHGYTLCINQGTPYSRGSVILASSDHRASPHIDPGYFSDERDLQATVAAAERMRAVAHAPSLARWTEEELFPGAEVRSRADWIGHIRANAGNHYHVSGTCRMGRTIEDSVTDPRLCVHGINGLRVADASIMPVLMNGNTNAAVAMIAERAAGLMAADS